MPDERADGWVEPRLPKEKIAELAMGIFTGRVFTSLQMKNEVDLLDVVFLPLAFLEEDYFKGWQEHPPAFLCAPMAHAFLRSINGYPCFGEFQPVYPKDARLILGTVKRLAAASSAILEEGSDV